MTFPSIDQNRYQALERLERLRAASARLISSMEFGSSSARTVRDGQCLQEGHLLMQSSSDSTKEANKALARRLG
jgi:hypothetical protein